MSYLTEKLDYALDTVADTGKREKLKKDFLEILQDAMEDALRRHTWMKDGISYVGNGTYTLKEAETLIKRDYPDIFAQ